MGVWGLRAEPWGSETTEGGQMNDGLGVFFTRVVQMRISKRLGRGWSQGHW